MAVRQYIGARYVPEFANPLEWNKESAYEPLTIVYNAGNSYTSRQAVPAGIDITNNAYWALTGNYNAQIEQYRKEVATFDERITANADAISAETSARENAVSGLNSEVSKNSNDIEFLESRRELSAVVFVSPFIEIEDSLTQSCCAVDLNGVRNIWISKLNSENDVEIIRYNGTTKSSKPVGNLGHCNAMAYYNGKIYCATQGGDETTSLGIAVVDAQTLEYEKTYPINAWAIDVYNDEFYTMNNGDPNVHVYNADFIEQREIQINHTAIGVGQNILVTERGIAILENINQNIMPVEASVLSFYNFDGKPSRIVTFTGFGEVEQVTKYNDTFIAVQNMHYSIVICGEVCLTKFPTNGIAPEAFAARFTTSEISYPAKIYVDPSYSSDFSDGTENKPFKSCASLSTIIPLLKDVDIHVQSDCNDDVSFYGTFLNMRISGKTIETSLPRIGCNGSLYYSTGTFDKKPLSSANASVKFYNCIIKPKNNALFSTISNLPGWFVDCTFDYSDGEWMVCKSAARPVYVDNLKLVGNSTELNMNNMGSIGPVFVLDPESAIVFNTAVTVTNQNAKTENLENLVFANGWRKNGWVTAGGDTVVNMPHSSPNQMDQIKFGLNSGTMSIRHVAGVQTIKIDPEGNVSYPKLNAGEWRTVQVS